MRTTVAIAIAGALGVLARHTIQQVVPRHGGLPWGTFVVNVSGAFAVGFLFTILVRHFQVPMWVQEAMLVGFLGGYTTFSTLALETYLLGESDRYVLAAAYSVGTLVVGIGALVVGIHLARRL
jgi:fluoride exporter